MLVVITCTSGKARLPKVSQETHVKFQPPRVGPYLMVPNQHPKCVALQ
jgi:hypothetical protein